MNQAECSKQRRLLLRIAKLCIAITLMSLVLFQVDCCSAPSLFANVRWDVIKAGIALPVVSQLIAVVRRQMFVQERVICYRTLLPLFGVGLFSNTCLPSGIGGDAVRVELLYQEVPVFRAISPVFLDWLMGLLALTALLGIGLVVGLPPTLGVGVNLVFVTLTSWTSILFIPVLVLIAGLLVFWLPSLP